MVTRTRLGVTFVRTSPVLFRTSLNIAGAASLWLAGWTNLMHALKISVNMLRPSLVCGPFQHSSRNTVNPSIRHISCICFSAWSTWSHLVAYWNACHVRRISALYVSIWGQASAFIILSGRTGWSLFSETLSC